MIPIRRSAAVCAALACMLYTASSGAEVLTFDAPEHDGFLISYCASANGVCGERVAQRWCRQQGYERAVRWAAQPGLDFSTATVTLDQGSICRGAQCESFASISCESDGQTFRMPALGGLARATLIAPNRRSAEVAVAPVEYQVLIPGCHQREPGIFMCETVHEYQHCRTLLRAGKVFGCRAGLAFDGGFAVPVAASSEQYALELRSTAEVIVERGERGAGRLRGEARFEVAFAPPDHDRRDWCLQRDRYVYFPSGPRGGLAEIDATAACDEPVQGRFAPHEDHLLEAYDLCEGSLAWGEALEHDMRVLVGALFHFGSARPDFEATHDRKRIVAPYITLEAPLRIRCRD